MSNNEKNANSRAPTTNNKKPVGKSVQKHRLQKKKASAGHKAGQKRIMVII